MSIDAKRTKSIQEAMVQNADFFGFDLCDTLSLGESGEEVAIMYRDLLDAATKTRVDTVYREHARCDRQMITMDDGSELPGPYKEPRTLNDQPYDLDVELCKALWGEEKFNKYVDAGGPPGLVLMTWSRMRQQINERVSRDPK